MAQETKPADAVDLGLLSFGQAGNPESNHQNGSIWSDLGIFLLAALIMCAGMLIIFFPDAVFSRSIIQPFNVFWFLLGLSPLVLGFFFANLAANSIFERIRLHLERH